MIGCGLWLRCGIFGYKTKDEDRDQDRESAKIMLSRISTGNNAQLRHNYNWQRRRRGSRRTMATGAATTMDNNNHILFWKLYEGIASIICVSVSVTGSTYYLWKSALCAPFSILQSLFAIRHSVIQCGPICCDCRCTSTSRICGTVSGPEIPFPFPHTAEQCQATHTRTGRAKESVSRRIIVVWYLSLKWINSMDPSPMWCNYSYLVA